MGMRNTVYPTELAFWKALLQVTWPTAMNHLNSKREEGNKDSTVAGVGTTWEKVYWEGGEPLQPFLWSFECSMTSILGFQASGHTSRHTVIRFIAQSANPLAMPCLWFFDPLLPVLAWDMKKLPDGRDKLGIATLEALEVQPFPGIQPPQGSAFCQTRYAFSSSGRLPRWH